MPDLTPLLDFLVERPVLLLLLASLPLVPLAWLAKIFPAGRLLILASIPAVASLLLVWQPGWATGLAWLDLMVVAIAIFDLARVPPASDFAAKREAGRVVSLGKPHQVAVVIDNRSRFARRVDLADDLPDEFQTIQREFHKLLPPRSRTTIEYRLQALRRGLFRMEWIHLRTRSPWGLWHRYLRLAAETEVHVYPDLKQLGQYELLARTNRLSLLGMRRSRRIGNENEFERLRNYTLDDDHRHIDWRASARRRELTVRDFQTNQNQQVLFMVDCGRLMTGTGGQLPLLDHSLNAVLMLSWIALSRGDSVGLLLFSNRILGFVPPRSGTSHVNRMLHASFNHFASYTESRFDLAFRHLDQKVRKRSLVILITNLMDQINANLIRDHLAIVAGKHLPLGVFLRDQDLFGLHGLSASSMASGAATAWQTGFSSDPAGSEDTLAAQAVAQQIIAWRAEVLARLALRGVLTLDVAPEAMTAPLVNQYLEIKARGLL